MSTRFFGRFLVDRGRITGDQLHDAVRMQDRTNQPVGRRAVDQGYMRHEDAEWINQLQRTRDRRFGELALETGMLTEDQLGELLISQAQDWMLLGELLVDRGLLSQEELIGELEEFSRQEQHAPETLDKLYAGRHNARLLGVFADVTAKIFLRVAHERIKFSSCHGDPGAAQGHDYSVRQRFVGKFEGLLCLNLPSRILLRVAGRMLEMDLDERAVPDEDALDGVAEFLNIISGHVCIKLGNLGLLTELLAPEVTDHRITPLDMVGAARGGQFTATELHHPEGRLEICVIDRSNL